MRGHGSEFPEQAGELWSAHHARVDAVVVPASQAKLAPPASDVRFHSYFLARMQVVDARAYGFDHARGLVSQNLRQDGAVVGDAAFLEPVQIAAADTDGAHAHLYFARSGIRRHLHFTRFQCPGSYQLYRSHG